MILISIIDNKIYNEQSQEEISINGVVVSVFIRLFFIDNINENYEIETFNQTLFQWKSIL